ncbi:MAG: hypothetical protein U0Y68_22195 [Blastocatellia bacterium]
MLYSRHRAGDLGVPRIDGGRVETDHRKIWQLSRRQLLSVSRHRPLRMWLAHELMRSLRY